MSSLNKLLLIGNLGRDAEITATASGFPIARFSLATTHRRKDSRSGQWEDQTEWHRIVVLGQIVERIGQYLRKGKQVYVEGRIETRSWEDKDGNKRYMTEVIADRVQLLGGGAAAVSSSQPVPERGAPSFSDPADAPDDDVPF